MSSELMRKIDDVLDTADVPERHTYFQMKHFIVGKEPTIQGQLWQVVRELRSRRETLEAMTEQLADLEDDISLCHMRIVNIRTEMTQLEEANQARTERGIALNKAERQRRAMYRTKTSLEHKIVYLSQEIAYLLGAFETLSKAEPIKPLDDIDAQQQYWNEKFTEELNLRLLLGKPLDPDFVRTIMSLDENSLVKQQMTKILTKVQEEMIAQKARQMTTQNGMKSIKE